MSNSLLNVIIIDDDTLSNMISKKVIQKMFPMANIVTFAQPEEGLNHIKQVYSFDDVENAILFLDINMPVLSGWDVLEKYNEYTNTIKSHIKIFMFSSSIDKSDMERALSYPTVSGYIPKPLSNNQLSSLLS
jgi:CheY-like chemotaxis protein